MNWWNRLLRKNQLENQLDKELLFHLEQHANDLIGEGYSPQEAHRRAMIDLGGLEKVKEECRDSRGTRWLEDLFQDFRYAIRSLRRKPGFAVIALLTLALGNGATTIMFTLVNGVLLKPLPYAAPDRLVRLQERTEKATQFGNLWAFSFPNFLDVQREARALEMAAYRFGGGTVSKSGQAEFVAGLQVSSTFFSLLGINPLQGRDFLPDEDKQGGQPVMIISDSLAHRLFGGTANAVGAALVFEGKPVTVIGVAPAALQIDGDPEVFTLIGQNTGRFMQMRGWHPGIGVWARLRPNAAIEQAQEELTLIGRNLAEQYPDSNAGRDFLAEPLRPQVGSAGSTLWLLFGAVSLVLLIACANVASLLLARAVSREREFAIRTALGAGRFRLARQCLTESAVLAFLGGGLGVFIAWIGVSPFVLFWPGSLPRASEVELDWQVFMFALAVSLLSGLIFGLAPALRAPARNLEQTLRAGARTVVGSSRRLHGAFVVSEIALAIVLLVSAGMLARTLLHLSSLDSGLSARNVLVTRMALSPAILTDPAKIRVAWQEVIDRARAVPGVEAIATVDTVPLREGNNQMGYGTTPDLPPPFEQTLALATSVSPDYLKVMGISLKAGRFFDDRDRKGTQPVIVIDDVLARNAFGAEDAVGKPLWVPNLGSDPVQVIGVVGHVRHWGAAADDRAQVRAQIYYPFAQVDDTLLRRWSELMSIAVRTNVDPVAVLEPLRRAVRGASGDQVLHEIRTLDQLAANQLAQQRFLLLLFSIFAGLAMLLACVGIYGVLAYLTGQRVPEIGVRIALGATASDVVRMVLRQSLIMIAVGVVIGGVVAFGTGRVLLRLVEGMTPAEPLTFLATILVLVGAALVASYVPARRASRIDPIAALRQE